MAIEQSDVAKKMEDLNKRRAKVAALRKGGNQVEAQKEDDKIKDKYGSFDFAMIAKQEKGKNGEAEVGTTIKKGLEVLNGLTDGNVSSGDVKNYNDFVSNLAARISDIHNKIAYLQRVGSPEAQAMIDDLHTKLAMLSQVHGAVSRGGEGYVSSQSSNGNVNSQVQENGQANKTDTSKIFFDSLAGRDLEAQRQQDCKMAAEASKSFLKALAEGRDTKQTLRAIGLDANGNLIMNGYSMEELFKNKASKRLSELSGRSKTSDLVNKQPSSHQKTNFNAQDAARLMSQKRGGTQH